MFQNGKNVNECYLDLKFDIDKCLLSHDISLKTLLDQIQVLMYIDRKKIYTKFIVLNTLLKTFKQLVNYNLFRQVLTKDVNNIDYIKKFSINISNVDTILFKSIQKQIIDDSIDTNIVTIIRNIFKILPKETTNYSVILEDCINILSTPYTYIKKIAPSPPGFDGSYIPPSEFDDTRIPPPPRFDGRSSRWASSRWASSRWASPRSK